MLERAGLVERRIDGRLTRCTLEAAPLRGAAEWVERYREAAAGLAEQTATASN